MRVKFVWIFLLLASALGCGQIVNTNSAPTIVGSGKVVHESRAVADFNGVVVRGSGIVFIEQGIEEKLTVAADDNLLPYLTSEVVGSNLILGTKPGVTFSPSQEIVVHVSVKVLKSIECAGSARIEAKSVVVDRLTSKIAGSGAITVAGGAEQQEIEIRGSGTYRADQLRNKTTDISISGSGSVEVNASEELRVNIAGSGSVTYSGSPQVTKNIAGNGTVRMVGS